MIPEPTQDRPRAESPIAIPCWAIVFGVACAVFGFRLGAEGHFVDESAYVSQSYFADLFLEGRRDDPAWLDYPAVDLPPLAKYLVGFALRAGGFRRPGPSAAFAWYENPSRRFETDQSLVVARIPSVVLGAVGCVAIYAIGVRAFGRPAGLIAAALLMASPLYRLHARRAMSDVPAEAFMLVALAIGLAAWSRWMSGRGGWRGSVGTAIGAGVFTGLAVLAKLNGSIAGMVLGAWAVLGLGLRGVPIRSKLGLASATLAAGLVAFGTFAALNPFLTAHPPGPLPAGSIAQSSFLDRVRIIKDHRVEVSRKGQVDFAHNALTTLPAKVAAVAVQGYGRFSPLGPSHSDSTRRFDRRQDWGGLIWGPVVALGFVAALRRGRLQRLRREPPTAWAVALAAAVALAVVTSFIPLAWDRYYLSIQAGSVLLASAALTAPFDRLRRPAEDLA